MTRFADDYVKFRAASQRYGSKVHALGASAPPRARSSPHEGRIIPKRSRRSHGWRTWGQPFAMHRRELTALSTAARTRVHIRDASPRADSAFYGSADPRPYITSACCTSRQRYEGQQTPWEQLACPALLRTVRYLRYGGPSRRRPIAYTQHMQSAAPPVRVRSRAPLTQPHRRYIRCCVVRVRGQEAGHAQDAADLRRDASRSRTRGGEK